MTKIASIARSFVREEEGATMVEYALLVALIAVALITSWTAVKNGIGAANTKSTTALNGV